MCKRANCMYSGCTNDGIIPMRIAKRGNRNGYLCNFHARYLAGYSEENGIHSGDRKKHNFTFSFENETSNSDLKARAELVDFDFLPTRDGTVDVEYKSPIYEGFCAMSKQLVSIEKLIENGHLEIGNECGTHFHVGHWTMINPQTMRYLRRFNNSLFVPLSEAIMADVEKSERLFGRQPNHWAEPVTWNDFSGNVSGWEMKHEAMFNLQHDWTIEFRQCKFINAKQYMTVAKFARDVVDTLIKNFIMKFDSDFDRNTFENVTAYRKHIAQYTGRELVKLYFKYTSTL